jgi:hypothetical protein
MLGSVMLVVLLAGQAAPAVAQAPSARPTVPVVTYDEFMIKPVGERIGIFNQVSPENRADLVRTHLSRWLERNADRLSDEQKEVMDENLGFITPDRYRGVISADDQASARALEERTAKVFSRDEARQALTLHGDYIPQMKK